MSTANDQVQNSRIEEILRGSFDLHVHAAPDPDRERRLDALDAARHAHEAEMAGFVLKSHRYPTAPLAQALSRVYPGLSVAGSIALNREVGGLNRHAVLASARMGARVVWMPTFDAHFWTERHGEGDGIRIADSTGRLLPQVYDILGVVLDHDMVVASGHVSPSEAVELFTAARDMGIRRLIATHPAETATVEEMRKMTSLGALLELTFLSCMPSVASATPGGIADLVNTLRVESCVVTTDFGQWVNPPPAEGMRMAIAALLDAGLGASDVSTLVKENPLRLLGMA